MDEKGFPIEVALLCKVICKKGPRSAKLTQDCSREWVAVMGSISGDGRVLRPMITNKGKAHTMGPYAKLKKKRLG